jgi:NADH-quinone oxidoreductase subunit G
LHAPGKELEMLKAHLPRFAEFASAEKKGALFLGRQYGAMAQRRAILQELVKWQQSVPQLTLNLLEGRGNSMGARFSGMRPDIGPCNTSLKSPGLNAVQMIEEAARTGWDFLYIAGANPALKYPSDTWQRMREKLKMLVVQDLFLTETAQHADVVLPTLSFVEKGGTFMNIEGRMQKLLPGKMIPSGLYSDGQIFIQLARKLGVTLSFEAKMLKALKKERVTFPRQPIVDAPGVAFQEEGSLAASFAPSLFDHGVRMRHNPHVVQLAKLPRVRIHPSEGERRGIRDGGVVCIQNKISVPIQFDNQVAEGAIVLPLGFPDVAVQELAMSLMNGMEIVLERA